MFAEFDRRIASSMRDHAIPGVALGVWYHGREYLKGYGVTSVDASQQVTPDTIFRIGSVSKTCTGTAVKRLVQAGKVDLDSTVRRYLPDLATSDPSVAESVTVRQLLNHTAGWLADDLQDFGPGDNAVAGYTASIPRLPILTRPGSTMFYQNAGLVVAGRIVEVVTGMTYERAVKGLLLAPSGSTGPASRPTS